MCLIPIIYEVSKLKRSLMLKKNVLLEFTQDKDPAIAFVTSSAVTKPLSNPKIFTGFVM